METKNGFTKMTVKEFETWILQQDVARTILFVQQHHTFLPAYAHFTGNNHFQLQKGMQTHHVVANGWLDIGQHFSIFPDGTILTGRSLERTPACIKGRNTHAVCIENVGNFDRGQDIMRQEQRNAILRVTAALCKRFRIPIDTNHIVYHHWYDLISGSRTNGTGVTKTCPGTAFFGGNTVAAAQEFFLPQVYDTVHGTIDPTRLHLQFYGSVTAQNLNVRNAPSVKGKIINIATLGAVLRIYEEKEGWYRISEKKREWVSGKFVQRVERGVINADVLNVRSGPGVQFPKTGEMKAGEDIFVYERQKGWLRIGIGENWVSERFVTYS